MWKVPLFELNYNDKESLAVKNVLNSKWLSMGEKTIELEDKFSKFMGPRVNSIAVSSCTAAIHLSLLAIGVKKGDEVIIPALSFISQLNIIKNIGAKPVLIDCSSMDNWNININQIYKKVTKKTKAIIILHYAGFPCEISKDIIDLCRAKNITIIEDVAHAPGAQINSKKCGNFGDIGCFSFFSNKNISAGEGGMVVTKNKQIEKRVRYLRSHGMTSLSFDKKRGRAVDYDVVIPGLNYRIDEIRSVLAIEQMKKLNRGNQLRKINFELYKKLLKNTEIIFPFSNYKNNKSNAFHILSILLPKFIDRNEVISFLKSKGIQSSLHYLPYWSFSIYKEEIDSNDFPILKNISNRQLTLPLYPTLKKDQIEYVCDNLKKLVK